MKQNLAKKLRSTILKFTLKLKAAAKPMKPTFKMITKKESSVKRIQLPTQLLKEESEVIQHQGALKQKVGA